MQEWLNWHAWKACKPLKGFRGSNPLLSANKKKLCEHTAFFVQSGELSQRLKRAGLYKKGLLRSEKLFLFKHHHSGNAQRSEQNPWLKTAIRFTR